MSTWSLRPANPHVSAPSTFEPSDVNEPPEPPQFPPGELFATIVLLRVVSPGWNRPPPRFAPLPAIVTLRSVAVSRLASPPPSVTAVFPLSVTLANVSVPSF